MKMNVAPIITSFLHKLWKMCHTGYEANKEECWGRVHESESLSRPPLYTLSLSLSLFKHTQTHSSYIRYYCFFSCHYTVLDKTCMRADGGRSFSFLSILWALEADKKPKVEQNTIIISLMMKCQTIKCQNKIIAEFLL